MNYYTLAEKDHDRPSWVLNIEPKPSRRRPRHPEIVPTVHTLLGQPTPVGLVFKSRYTQYCCEACLRFDPYQMFDEGFDGDVTIRIKGDFGHTTDRIFVVNDRFVRIIEAAGAIGYERKHIGNTQWHALKITRLVEIAAAVIKTRGRRCPICKRPEESWGLVQRVGELESPPRERSFFASERAWPHPFQDREVFLTEDLVTALKRGGIKGGYCYRLFTDEEWPNLEVNAAGVVDNRPRGSTVFL